MAPQMPRWCGSDPGGVPNDRICGGTARYPVTKQQSVTKMLWPSPAKGEETGAERLNVQPVRGVCEPVFSDDTTACRVALTVPGPF